MTAPGPVAPRSGGWVLRFDAREYETSGALRITDVVPLGPAAVTGGAAPGDVLVSVDGVRPAPASISTNSWRTRSIAAWSWAFARAATAGP